MKLRLWLRLALCILISEGAGLIGAFFTRSSVQTWYAVLEKPPLSPPNWVFAPVWTLLYALMGIALYLIWTRASSSVWRTASRLFAVQLVLNILWSFVFFGQWNPAAALVVIFLLWVMILATMIEFKKVSRAAFWLMAPYLLWVSFAIYLNFMFWQLNAL